MLSLNKKKKEPAEHDLKIQRMKLKAILTVLGVMFLFVIITNITTKKHKVTSLDPIENEMDRQLDSLLRTKYQLVTTTVLFKGEYELIEEETDEIAKLRRLKTAYEIAKDNESSDLQDKKDKYRTALLETKERIDENALNPIVKRYMRNVRFKAGADTLVCLQKTEENLKYSTLNMIMTVNNKSKTDLKEQLETTNNNIK